MAQAAPAPMDTSDNKITINADGTYGPPGGITINNGGVAKFDVTYPAGMTVCNIALGAITFSVSEGDSDTTGGTVKIGS
jgi:hypothetical protein